MTPGGPAPPPPPGTAEFILGVATPETGGGAKALDRREGLKS